MLHFLYFQDFAENTMNELLGWYGYDKVEEGETENLHLERFEEGGPGQMSGSESDLEGEDKEGHHHRDDLSNASMDSDSRSDLSSPGK